MNPLQEYLSSTPAEKLNTSMVAYVANLTKVAEVAPDIASDVIKEFDTQRKHLKLIKSMAIEAENVTKISLPNGLTVIKEYNFITFTNRTSKPSNKEYPFIKTCDIEITSEEYSYTYITVTKLQEMYLEHEFYFIMGADSLDYFEKWRKPEIIASICKILVINRDEFSEEDMKEKILRINAIFPAEIYIVHCPKIDVSSTELREKLDKNDVLPTVFEYICNHDLYGN